MGALGRNKNPPGPGAGQPQSSNCPTVSVVARSKRRANYTVAGSGGESILGPVLKEGEQLGESILGPVLNEGKEALNYSLLAKGGN